MTKPSSRTLCALIEELAGQYGAGANMVDYGAFIRRGDGVEDAVLDELALAVAPEDIAYILYTSGSTSRPKGVMLVHRGLIENMYEIGSRLHFTPQDSLFLPVSLFWGMGCENGLLAAWTHGTGIVLQHHFDADEALELMSRCLCTAIYGTGNIIQALFDHFRRPDYDLSKLTKGGTGGTPEQIRTIIETLVPGACHAYGMTETYGFMTVSDADDAIAIRSNSHGRPLPGMHLKIVDPDTGVERAQCVTGEVRVKGYTMAGYYKAPDATAEAYDEAGYLKPSGITGAFGAAGGAAAAAARLDAARTVQALGFAANCAGGLNQWAWSGSHEVFIHAGSAARNGLQAFDLARAGLDASDDVLEGRDGLFAAFGCGNDAAAIFAQSMQTPVAPAILDVRHKPVAGCNFIQTPVAAAFAARASLDVGSEEIDEIVLHSFEEAWRYPGCNYAGPFHSAQQSKMSLQFGVCTAVVRGALDEAAYAKFDDPEVIRLIDRFRFVIDPTYAGAFPARQGARVELRLRNGTVVMRSFADVPWLSDKLVIKRFHDELTLAGSDDRSRRIFDALDQLWDQPDCNALYAAFAS